MDWFVVLAPLVALGILALLGYAGCDRVFGVDPVEPPPPVHTVTPRVRIPNDLTVVQVRFRWTRPGATSDEAVTPTDRLDEGTTFVLSTVIPNAEPGSWSVTCRLEVSDGTAQQLDAAMFDFVLMPNTDASMLFTTQGRPASNDFEVVPPSGLD